MNFLTTDDAANELGVTARRIRAMLTEGILKGEQVGRIWLVDPKSLAKVKAADRPVGNPNFKKTKRHRRR